MRVCCRLATARRAILVGALTTLSLGCGPNELSQSAATGSSATSGVEPASADHIPPVAIPDGTRPTVLLLGIDGGEWALLDPLFESGALPNLAALVGRGARADLDCAAAMPETACFCPPVWVSIATGQPQAKHYVATIDHGSGGRGVPAIWNVLAAHGGRSTLVAFRNTWPPESDAAYVLTEPGLDVAANALYETYPPPPMSPPVLNRAFHTRPDGLFEELALLPFQGDRLPVRNMIGRDRVAMEALLRLARRDPTELTAVILHSPDKSAHLLWGTVQDTADSPVDAARVVEIAARWRGPVVGPGGMSGESVTSQVQEIDAWLGPLLERVHFDYVVLASDHGMTRRRGFGLPGAHGVEHPEAHQGIFAIAGPGVPAGTRLEGVTVFDVAPTIAYALGLPVADDLAGRVRIDAFSREWLGAHPVERVPSWASGDPSRAPSGEDTIPRSAR